MRRQALLRVVMAVVAVGGIGALAWAGSHGFLGVHGKATRLLRSAEGAAAQGKLPEAQASLERLLGQFPDAPVVDQAIMALGSVYAQQHQLVEARTMYRLLLDRFPNSPLIAEAQTKLGDSNVQLLFSKTVADNSMLYAVKAGGP